jgi:hypothetical protein
MRGWGWIRNYPGIYLMSQKDYVSPLRIVKLRGKKERERERDCH